MSLNKTEWSLKIMTGNWGIYCVPRNAGSVHNYHSLKTFPSCNPCYAYCSKLWFLMPPPSPHWLITAVLGQCGFLVAPQLSFLSAEQSSFLQCLAPGQAFQPPVCPAAIFWTAPLLTTPFQPFAVVTGHSERIQFEIMIIHLDIQTWVCLCHIEWLDSAA